MMKRIVILALATAALSASTAMARPISSSTRPDRPRAIHSYRLNSTAYCLNGRMSNGRYTHDGAVAVLRGWSLGHWYQVRSGPLKGKILKGEDHIGYGSQFDIWMPCSSAYRYGRRTILVAQITRRGAIRAIAAQNHPARKRWGR